MQLFVRVHHKDQFTICAIPALKDKDCPCQVAYMCSLAYTVAVRLRHGKVTWWGKLTHDNLALRWPSLPTLNTIPRGAFSKSPSRLPPSPKYLTGGLRRPMDTCVPAWRLAWRASGDGVVGQARQPLPQCLTRDVPGDSYWYLTLIF